MSFKLQGPGRIQALSIEQVGGRIAGISITAVLDGQALDIQINAPEGKSLEEAAEEGLNLDVEVSR